MSLTRSFGGRVLGLFPWILAWVAFAVEAFTAATIYILRNIAMQDALKGYLQSQAQWISGQVVWLYQLTRYQYPDRVINVSRTVVDSMIRGWGVREELFQLFRFYKVPDWNTNVVLDELVTQTYLNLVRLAPTLPAITTDAQLLLARPPPPPPWILYGTGSGIP